jgi:hypothetical protein
VGGEVGVGLSGVAVGVSVGVAVGVGVGVTVGVGVLVTTRAVLVRAAASFLFGVGGIL